MELINGVYDGVDVHVIDTDTMLISWDGSDWLLKCHTKGVERYYTLHRDYCTAVFYGDLTIGEVLHAVREMSGGGS